MVKYGPLIAVYLVLAAPCVFIMEFDTLLTALTHDIASPPNPTISVVVVFTGFYRFCGLQKKKYVLPPAQNIKMKSI